MLGIPTDRRRTCQWFSDDEALGWVERTYQQVWLRGGRLLQQFGKAVGEQVFDQLFTEHKAELFMDRERFTACLKGLPEIGKLLDLFGEDEGLDFYVGFSIDWSYVGESILWTPQLRISNFWPSNRRLAPEPLSTIPSPYPMSPQEAANVLGNFFWKRVGTEFRYLRHAFHLGEAGVWIGRREFGPPVFYYAEPTWMPEKPDEYLESPTCLSAIESLCRVTLGTDDPRSTDVAGAFLEGNLFTLRREITREKVQGFYLIIPWWSGDRTDWIEEVEREAVFVANKWFFVEFAAGFRSYDIETDLAMPGKSMALWGGTLDTAAELVSHLSNLVAYEPAGSPRKREAFKLVNQLRALLARLETKVLPVTDDVMGMKRTWEASVESNTRFAQQAFTSQPLPKVRHLLDALPNFFPYRYSGQLAKHAAEQAEQLRRTYDSVEKAIQDLLEQEHREEREREERFREEQRKLQEEQREREERHQRILGYGLAALAAITAFPILIGQMDWNELQQVISHWPKPFLWIGAILKALHPYLVLIATISAAVVIALLLGLLVWTALQNKVQRGRMVVDQGEQEGEDKEWQEIGVKIIQVWQLVEHTKETVNELRKMAFISRRVPGEELEEVKALRWQVDKWDQEACERLIEVWEWLKRIEQETEATPKDELDWFKLRVHRFIVATELLDNRPVPFPFPLALCLFRHKSTDFVSSTIVSDFEFEQILNGYGFDDDEVRAIDRWAEQPLSAIQRYANHELARQGKRLKDLPAKEFVTAMREIVGVSALHEREVKPPKGEKEEVSVETLRALLEELKRRMGWATEEGISEEGAADEGS